MLKKFIIYGLFASLLTGCVMAPTDESEGKRQAKFHPVRYEKLQSNKKDEHNHNRIFYKEEFSVED